jgi:hypothetical protein
VTCGFLALPAVGRHHLCALPRAAAFERSCKLTEFSSNPVYRQYASETYPCINKGLLTCSVQHLDHRCCIACHASKSCEFLETQKLVCCVVREGLTVAVARCILVESHRKS